MNNNNNNNTNNNNNNSFQQQSLRGGGSAREDASSEEEKCNFDCSKKYKVVFVLGGPGSGKGTNCAKIVRDFGYAHLSSGDILRAERDSGSKLAEMINEKIKNGELVAPDISIDLILKAVEKSGSDKILLDGFPRDMPHLEMWNQMTSGLCETQFLLLLNCPEDVMQSRLLERGKTSGRVDDNITTIQKRFKLFNSDTMMVIESFRAANKSKEVDSSRDPEIVYDEIKQFFQSTTQIEDKSSKVVDSSSSYSRDFDMSVFVSMMSAKVDTFIACTLKQPSLQIEDLESDSTPTSPV